MLVLHFNITQKQHQSRKMAKNKSGHQYFSLIKNWRDIRYQAYVDICYFITTPGDNIDLVAPILCDALLTLKNTEGPALLR